MKHAFFALLIFTMTSAAFARDFKIVSQEFMPIGGSAKDGKMAGVHFEIAKIVCDKLKFNCTNEVVPLARGLEMIKSGEAQMILGVAKNPEREAVANFPGMVTQVGYTFFVKKGQAFKYKSLEDFKGKTVGAHAGSATAKDLIEQNKKIGGAIKIVDETTAETPAKKLAGDRYGADNAAYIARAVGMYQAKMDNLDIEPVSFDPFLQSHSMAITKVGVTTEEFDKIKKSITEAMKTDGIKKMIAADGLMIHPDQK